MISQAQELSSYVPQHVWSWRAVENYTVFTTYIQLIVANSLLHAMLCVTNSPNCIQS